MTALAIATFDAEGPFLRARLRALAEERRVAGEWTPYASEALGGGEGTGGILAAAIVCGIAAAVGLFALTAWSAVLAYPFNTGARPLFSWPAFIPAPVEFGSLAAAVGGAVLFFVRAGLTQLHHHAFDLEEVGEVAKGAFVLAIACDVGEDGNAALAMLAAAGATRSRLVAP